MNYRVVSITNNVLKYPEGKKGAEEFPHLVDCVKDEVDIFVIAETGVWCTASEFFYIVDIDQFSSDCKS